jgi:hypothetical protein
MYYVEVFATIGVVLSDEVCVEVNLKELGLIVQPATSSAHECSCSYQYSTSTGAPTSSQNAVDSSPS